MQHLRVYSRAKRPSDPVPDVQFAPRFPLAEAFLDRYRWSDEDDLAIDFVVRLVRTQPGHYRTTMLIANLQQLGCPVPSTLTTRPARPSTR